MVMTMGLTAIHVCHLLNNQNKNMSDILSELPKTYQTPTMAPFCKDSEKYHVVDDLVKQIKEIKDDKTKIDGQEIKEIITVNGVRFSFEDGSWGLIRASSNKPSLVIVTESPTSNERKKKILEFIDNILKEKGNTKNVLDNPLNAVLWLINTLCKSKLSFYYKLIMRTTLKNISDDTGLSIATVSRALNRKKRSYTLNEEKIYASAQKLGYPFIEHLNKNNKPTIAVVAEIHPGEFYSSLFYGFFIASKHSSVNVVYINVEKDQSSITDYIINMRNNIIDF